MSDYRRFIAYLYEYPNNRKGGCCGFVRVESQNGFCRMDFQIKSPSLPPETSVTVYGFIRRSGRMYGIPLGNLLAGRSSTSGKLFTHSDAIGQTDVTLDELGGLILALPPDRRHRHPVGRSSDSAGVFRSHAPAGAQNIRRQWYQTDRRENCRNTRTSGSRRTCAVPAIIRRFKSTVR